MKLKSLTISGIGAVRQSTFPVEELGEDDRIVAVCGTNGAGKTTHLECVPGLIYGSVPSHGLLSAMANTPSSSVDAVFELDQDYRLQRIINAARKTPAVEAYIFDAAGVPLNDGHQKTFKAVIDKLFPPESLYLASGFLAQVGGKEFLDLPKVERKKLFTEMIGCGYLQDISEAASDKAKAITKAISEDRAKVSVLQEQASRVDELQALVTKATADLAGITEKRNALEGEELTRQHRLEEWTEENRKLTEEVNNAKARLATAQHKLDTERAKLKDRKDEQERAAAKRHELNARLNSRGAFRCSVASGETAQAEVESLRAELDAEQAANNAWQEVHNEWGDTDYRLSSEMNKATQAHKAAIVKAQSELNHVQKNKERLTSQVSKLAYVPCHGDGEFATCPLLSLAVTAKTELELIDELITKAIADVESAKMTEAVDTAQAAFNAHLAAKPVKPETIDPAALNQAIRDNERIAKAGEAAAAQLAALTEVEAQLATLDSESKDIDADYARTFDITVLLLEDTAKLQVELNEATAAVDLHGSFKPDTTASTELAATRRAESEAGSTLARAEERLRSATEASTKLGAINAGIATATADLDDWQHLQRAFGRDGIQALELDAAGPEVSDTINSLLHGCFGSRFSARLETTQLLKDASGTKEVFDLMVIDSKMGREGSASDLSGGERVIVGEAISLAVAIFNSRKSSVPIRDLFRDEVSGALDADSARRYLAMLRSAIDAGGFHRIYFISHQPELWSLSDAVIRVADGVAKLAEVL